VLIATTLVLRVRRRLRMIQLLRAPSGRRVQTGIPVLGLLCAQLYFVRSRLEASNTPPAAPSKMAPKEFVYVKIVLDMCSHRSKSIAIGGRQVFALPPIVL